MDCLSNFVDGLLDFVYGLIVRFCFRFCWWILLLMGLYDFVDGFCYRFCKTEHLLGLALFLGVRNKKQSPFEALWVYAILYSVNTDKNRASEALWLYAVLCSGENRAIMPSGFTLHNIAYQHTPSLHVSSPDQPLIFKTKITPNQNPWFCCLFTTIQKTTKRQNLTKKQNLTNNKIKSKSNKNKTKFNKHGNFINKFH